MSYRKKLIEVALPLEAINEASAREKSIRHGHPSTLHLWWARRPLAAARAVIFASLVDDPDATDAPPAFVAACRALPRGRNASDNDTPRMRLFDFIEQLVKWESTTDEEVLKTARELINLATDGNPPPLLDPFAGGGSIPLEAQRLGLEAHASDLNPVAVMINKAMIEIPPRFANQPPVNPRDNPGARTSRPQTVETETGVDDESAGGTPVRQGRHRGWHSRGYLPHYDKPGLLQSITFRLDDALPTHVLERMKADAEIKNDDQLRQKVEEYLDAGHGECHLRNPLIAQLVENALQHFDGERYRLIAWVIMPNHVHVLIEIYEGHPMDKVVHSWKSFTSKEANKILGRSGQFWAPDYFDRYIRNQEHFNNVVRYIHYNPLKAGLVKRAEDWQYSSASLGEGNIPKATRSPGVPPVVAETADGTPGGQGALLNDGWRGATGLAADVRYYGEWMRERAWERIGHLYPTHNGETVIAWLWARTVQCPNPACRAQMPLVRSFELSKKKGKRAWVEPRVDRTGDVAVVHFEVSRGDGKAPDGTVKRSGATCICCGSAVPFDYIRDEGKAGRMDAQMMAIVTEGQNGRNYYSPTPEQNLVAQVEEPDDAPDTDLPEQALGFRVQLYGMVKHRDLFTFRQLVTLTTLVDLVTETRKKAIQHALAAGLPDDDSPLHEGGLGPQAYAEAISIFLSTVVSKATVASNSLARWRAGDNKTAPAFGRQALAMVWDYAETNPFAGAGGDFFGIALGTANALEKLPAYCRGTVTQRDAAIQPLIRTPMIVSTDPPYYDNIGYADLSDFSYVWLRPMLKSIYPTEFSTMLVPKEAELIAAPFRFNGNKNSANKHFEQGLMQAFAHIRNIIPSSYPLTVYYAFKQSELVVNLGVASTGWETMLSGLVETGFSIGGTWPIRTEGAGRLVASGTNALASSIVLVCRPRPDDAPTISRRDFVSLLRRELPAALREMQSGNIAPVDLAQAAIGPGMAVYSRYSQVLEANGESLTVRSALQLINQELDSYLSEQEGDVDSDTRFAIAWFDQSGFDESDFGVADVLARAKNTSVDGVVQAGIATSGRGKVRLRHWEDADWQAGWDPAVDSRVTVWEATHHLIQRLIQHGEKGAARLLLKLDGEIASEARQLAYRLYSICERKSWADHARAYNSLVISWPAIQEEVTRQQQELAAGDPTEQGNLFE